MSHAWLKKYLKMKPEVTKIFEDLEDFKLFCADFGHPFNEAYLYNKHNQVWKDYQNIIKGRDVKNMWWIDADKMRNA
jgi:hypothetical protein